VTGHRRLVDEEALAEQVRRALRRIRELLPSSAYTPVLFTVISPLAEGADRLVAREVLKTEGADLEVPLPLPREEYLRDFQSDESKREFDDLLSQAKEVTELGPSESREEAYQRVGRYVVDRCDVFIALWDGEPSRGQGGTAEIVEYARTRELPLFWIRTKGRYELLEELGKGIDETSFRQLDEYNRAKIAQEQFDRQVDEHRNHLLRAAKRLDANVLPLQVISERLSPFYVRADLLAMRYQNWYYILGNALFLLAAAAVAAIASQVVFAPERLELVWIEVALMLGVLLILMAGRLWRFHDRWISYRFLAERFRSAFFLGLAGLRGHREASLEHIHLSHVSEEWLRRAFGEVWSRRPQVELTESSVEDLRQFLAEAWIEDQGNFHRSAHHKYKARHVRLSRITEFLFGATVLAAGLHALGVGEHGSVGSLSLADLLILLAISMPALGAAVGGILAEREYLRNSGRYAEMVGHLEAAKRRMEPAQDLETVRTVAADAENLMLEENRDWFVVMSIHEMRAP
jgi:hypothetical protein